MSARLDSLTGLRAVAAGVVFVHHLPKPDGIGTELWENLARHGGAGVTLFFALSGFVLTWSLRSSDSATDFYRRRFARIYPALFVALLGSLVVYDQIGSGTDLAHALPAFLLLQAWSEDPAYFYAVNPATWSLSCEAFFYLTFPLYAHRLRVLSGSGLALAALALALAVVALSVWRWQEDAQLTWLGVRPPIIPLAMFVLGALLAVAVSTGRVPRVPLVPAVIAAAVIYALVGFAPNALSDDLRPLVPVLLVIAALATAELAGRSLRLASRGMIWAGQISYAFYLVHSPVIDLLDHHLPVAGVMLLSLPLVLAAACALHYAVERPLERLIRGTNSVVVAGVTPQRELSGIAPGGRA